MTYCKYILGVKRSSSNLASRLELGRSPIEKFIKIQSLLYYARLHTTNINPLLKESFDLCKTLDSEHIYSWVTYIKDIISDTDIDVNKINSCKTSKNLKSVKAYVKSEISEYYDNMANNKIKNLNEQNKLFLYKSLKTDLGKEHYLSHYDFETRKNIAKFRISDHFLEIEQGRYKKIPRDQRFCNYCKNQNSIDDELHFFLHCDHNKIYRKILFKDYEINFDHSEQYNLTKILSPTNFRQTQSLASFIKQSSELRTGDSKT